LDLPGSQVAKFYGIAAVGPHLSDDLATLAAHRLTLRARLGFGLPCRGLAKGFVIQPWLTGARPHLDADTLAAYILAIRGPPLSAGECSGAHARLCELVRVNLGDTRRQTERADLLACAAGDGDLSPCHWIRSPSGTLAKVGSPVREHGHTWVGQQTTWWDVASAVWTWRIDPALLIRALAARGLAAPAPALLDLHILAYGALRLAQLETAALSARSERYSAAIASERHELERLLGPRR
jgi:hypothetical protein